VVHGNPNTTQLLITRAHSRPPPTGGGDPCPARRPGDSTFVAFILGGIGPPATEAPTLCFGQQCDQSYTPDPARHLLAAEPHLVFRLSDLRPDTRMGNVIRFRLALDRAPDGLQAIAVFTTQERTGELREEWLVEILRPNAVGTWDFSQGCIGCRPTTTVRVYFFTR
jgi:hypothetical protein